jgi:hypothetical protein
MRRGYMDGLAENAAGSTPWNRLCMKNNCCTLLHSVAALFLTPCSKHDQPPTSWNWFLFEIDNFLVLLHVIMRVWGNEGMRVWGYEGMRVWWIKRCDLFLNNFVGRRGDWTHPDEITPVISIIWPSKLIQCKVITIVRISICFGSLSCWNIHLAGIFSLPWGSICVCKVSWYFTESMMPSTRWMCPFRDRGKAI